MNHKWIAFWAVCLLCLQLMAQQGVHAHNDYEHEVPFWTAFSAGCNSIEADIFLQDGLLLVAHELKNVKPEASLEELYLKPLRSVYASHSVFRPRPLQILIDIKTETYSSLKALISLLEAYPDLTSNTDLRLVISGNRPLPSEYNQYPDFIWFDYQQTDLRPPHPEKVALVSLSFSKLSKWNGKGRIIDEDQERIKAAIDFAHQLEKPVRFWGTPDNATSWFTFKEMGIDWINTDKPFEAVTYLKQSANAKVDQRESRAVQLYAFDNQKKLPPSVILMIGDGNGLAHISAGILSEKGKTNLTRFKEIGLVTTASADDKVTDSAAGATALASGHKTKNRYIGVDENGIDLKSIPDYVKESHPGMINALLTTDEITGATPSAFYGHVRDRDSAQTLIGHLENSHIDWFVSGGRRHFNGKKSKYEIHDSWPVKNLSFPSGLLLFEKSMPYKSEGRRTLFTQSLGAMLQELENHKDGFFLMVENGHIDGAGHENKAVNLVEEVLDLDKAVGIAMDFVDAHPGTLLIVTADHETGGLSLPHGTDNQLELHFQGDDHTGILVPVFAYGNQADIFKGFQDNTDIFKKILVVLGIGH